MMHSVGELGGVRVVGHHDDGLAVFAVELGENRQHFLGG